MKKAVIFCCSALLLSVIHSAHAGETPRSLFFTAQEWAAQKQDAGSFKNTSFDPARLALDAILYYGPGRWTLWMQGREWSADTKDAECEVLEVTPEYAKLRWHAPPYGQVFEFTLRPHQAFDSASQKVIGGL